MNNPKSHICHRHWAFALFKKGEFAKAIKKIKKAVQKNKKDPDNWIVWGLILRTVGNYVSARHKFQKALKFQPDNVTALEELATVERIMELDSQIPLEAVPSLRRPQNKNGVNNIEQSNGLKEVCARSCTSEGSNCTIF